MIASLKAEALHKAAGQAWQAHFAAKHADKHILITSIEECRRLEDVAYAASRASAIRDVWAVAWSEARLLDQGKSCDAPLTRFDGQAFQAVRARSIARDLANYREEIGLKGWLRMRHERPMTVAERGVW